MPLLRVTTRERECSLNQWNGSQPDSQPDGPQEPSQRGYTTLSIGISVTVTWLIVNVYRNYWQPSALSTLVTTATLCGLTISQRKRR